MSSLPPLKPSPLGGRDPLKEARVRAILQAWLSAYLPIALLTRSDDDDRIVLGLLQMLATDWDRWADLLFGPKG